MGKEARHCILIPDELWKRLCEEAGKQQAERQKPMTPALLAREILTKELKPDSPTDKTL
jgi:hypothetical protein